MENNKTDGKKERHVFTPAELEKFKAGKIDLWLARYSLSVRRSCEVGADEMRAALTV